MILDGHYSHYRNLTVIDLTRETGVIIVCLPPNSRARVHPLDVALMFPFKTFHAQGIENRLSNHHGIVVGNLQISRRGLLKFSSPEDSQTKKIHSAKKTTF